MEEKKITYKQLTWPLKTVVILGWITITIYVMYFIAGFTAGILGY